MADCYICMSCGGSGEVDTSYTDHNGNFHSGGYDSCPSCRGAGMTKSWHVEYYDPESNKEIIITENTHTHEELLKLCDEIEARHQRYTCRAKSRLR